MYSTLKVFIFYLFATIMVNLTGKVYCEPGGENTEHLPIWGEKVGTTGSATLPANNE